MTKKKKQAPDGMAWIADVDCLRFGDILYNRSVNGPKWRRLIGVTPDGKLVCCELDNAPCRDKITLSKSGRDYAVVREQA